jgi:glutathione S-transferase
MITVYHLNNSRSQRILWMLEELNLEYVIIRYERDEKTLQGPASLREIHPLGKAPVITDDTSGEELVLVESGAIIEYLMQNYGKNSSLIIPKTGSQQERDYRYWLHFSEGSLMSPLLLRLIFHRIKTTPVPFFVKPITKAIANKVLSEFVNPNIDRLLDFIDTSLKGKQWFLGDQLNGADIQMSYPLEASVASGLIHEQYPEILSYVERIHRQPPYQEALLKAGKYEYA